MARDNGSPQQGVADRITVGLVTRAAEDLERTQTRTGFSKTDIVNRALSLYDFLDAALAAGDEVILRRKGSGECELIRLL